MEQPKLTVNSMSTTSREYKAPLDDPNYAAFDHYTLRKIATYLKALEELEASINEDGMHVWLNSPIVVQGEGFRYGYIKPVDDFWVFVPDIKEDDDVE